MKWIIKYLIGTSKTSLWFGKGKYVIDGYTNVDKTGDVDSGKSTSCYVMNFIGRVILWLSRLKICDAFLLKNKSTFMLLKHTKKYCAWRSFYKRKNVKQEKYVVYDDS